MTQQRDFEVPPDIIRVFITNFNGVDKPYEFRLDWTLLQVKTILGEVLSTPAGNLVLTDAANNVALSADLRTLGELGIENLGRLSVTSVLSGIQLTSVHVVLIRRNGTTFSFDMVTEENATVGQVKSDIVTRVGRDIERAQMAQGVGNQGTGTGAGAGVVSFDIFVKVDGKLVASGDDGKSIRECFAGGNEDNVVFVVL